MKTVEDALMEHQIKSNNLAKRMLKAGKDETSAIIEYTARLKGDEVNFETLITLLPVRRLYKSGSKIIDDDDLLYEKMEEIE